MSAIIKLSNTREAPTGFDWQSGLSESFMKDKTKGSASFQGAASGEDAIDFEIDSIEQTDAVFEYRASSQVPRANNTIAGDSASYVILTTKVFVGAVQKELEEWRLKGAEDSLAHISHIKDLIDENYDILSRQSETRLLATALDLLFQNENWTNVKASHIKILEDGLKKFGNGEVFNKNLDKFMQLLYRNDFAPLG